MINPLRLFRKKVVGIDIGTATIKVVELSHSGNRIVLENYGEVSSSSLERGSLLNGKGNNALSIPSVASAIRSVLNEAKIKTKEVIFSIPDFLTFYTSFEIPAMTPQEIPGAVHYSATQYITLPISEVTLDWRVLSNSQSAKSIKIFLVAVPNQVVQDYQAIAKKAGLELYALEAEVFGLTRALENDNKKTVCMLDLGAETSTISIIDRGALKSSFSVNFSGNQFTHELSSRLKLDLKQAENIKIREGFASPKREVLESVSSLIDSLFGEMRNVLSDFVKKEQREIEVLYLAGGLANMPGLKEHISQTFKKEVLIPNCFTGFSYPSLLTNTLSEMSPRFSVAVGVALSRFES